MATRSTIAVVLKDGSVRQIYCHWDGYLEHNGAILKEHYTDQMLAEEIVSKGDMRTLSEKQEEISYFGESHHSCRDFRNLQAFMAGRITEEFNYLLKDGVWLCTQDDQLTFLEF